MAAIFTHMKEGEIEIFQKYIDIQGLTPQDFVYDVSVGAGAPIPPGTAPAMQRIIEQTTQHRIDAIRVLGGMTILFEVKRDFGLAAIGQALGYKDLLSKDIKKNRYTFPDNFLLFIIYESAEFDVVQTALDLGVDSFQIPKEDGQ